LGYKNSLCMNIIIVNNYSQILRMGCSIYHLQE